MKLAVRPVLICIKQKEDIITTIRQEIEAPKIVGKIDLDNLSGQKKKEEQEVQKKIELSIPADIKIKNKVEDEYDRKLLPLNKSYEDKINIIKSGLISLKNFLILK